MKLPSILGSLRRLGALSLKQKLVVLAFVSGLVVGTGFTVEAGYGLISKINGSDKSVTSELETADEPANPLLSALFGTDKKEDAKSNDSDTKKQATTDSKQQSASKKEDSKKAPASSAGVGSGGSSGGGASTPSTSPSQPSAPAIVASTKFGMSAPPDKWSQRLAEVGPANIKYRRIFFQAFGDNLSKVSDALNAGMIPILSWKTGNYSWAQIGAGAADADLYSLVSRLNAIPGPKILVVHHEPMGDGTPADYVAMQQRALPILGTANQASVGVIANGWWWSAQNQGYTDAEIAQWIPTSVKNVSDFIAADFYQDANLGEDGSVKAARMAAWARRTGGVSALGVGEFNGFTAVAITNLMNVVKSDSLYKWAAVWNSGPTGLGTPLEGDRLKAFQDGMANSGSL